MVPRDQGGAGNVVSYTSYCMARLPSFPSTEKFPPEDLVHHSFYINIKIQNALMNEPYVPYDEA